MMTRVAIIGTAGRRDDAPRLSRRLYDAMYRIACDTIRDWNVDGAVSGGAAVADHLAVRAFLDGKVGSLLLYLPAPFQAGRYLNVPGMRQDPGVTSNRYHDAFSKACDVDSLAELRLAIDLGARVEVHKGFHRRNIEVAAACTHMLAMTFGNGLPPDRGIAGSAGEIPAVGEDVIADFLPNDSGFTDSRRAGLNDGGTSHTWGESWKPTIKRHVHLGVLCDFLR